MFVDRTKFDSRARYVDELSKLQDAMPADSLEEVEKLLTKVSCQIRVTVDSENQSNSVKLCLSKLFVKHRIIMDCIIQLRLANPKPAFRSLGVRGVITLSSILGLFLAVPPLHR